MSETKIVRVGLIGAGYIADWHGNAIKATTGAKVVAVADNSLSAAVKLSRTFEAEAFGSVKDMIASGLCDAVHVLTPPSSHCGITVECLRAGLHVLVEKPVSTTVAEAVEMQLTAKASGKILAAGHNFLSLSSYSRLRSLMISGDLGRVSRVEVNWCLPLAPLRSGPFGLWLLKEPKNLLLELGPHLYAFIVDLLGPPEVLHIELGQPVEIAGGELRHQSWRVMARVGQVDVSLNISLVEVKEDRSVTVWGSTAIARMDFGADTLIVKRSSTRDLAFNQLHSELSLAFQHFKQGISNAALQTISLNQKSPYALSFRRTVHAFVSAIAEEKELDPRFSFDTAISVMRAIEKTVEGIKPGIRPRKPGMIESPPTVMVIGGTGFIGRNLTKTLVDRGYFVRVVSRGQTGPFDDMSDNVETVSVSLRDKQALVSAMNGISTVFNLAKSTDETWENALQNDVGNAVLTAEAAIEAGVSRFIYTGTIASYDMSDPSKTITEHTGFANDMSDRNIYARSKAECERRLMELHKDRRLPLVIARPGIVVGHGGPLQHWGIGRWHGAGAVTIWGPGKNVLPFVLADDVSDGLIRMMENSELIGRSFNLVGEPMMSARDYFEAIHQEMGARIRVRSGSLHAFWLMDFIKSFIKRHVLGRTGADRSSLTDWKSRGHLSRFDNTEAKRDLGWQPEENRSSFVARAITNANLFGL